MAERDFLHAYLEGKIVAWTVVRRLLKAGVSLGTAIAFTALLPAAAESGDLKPLERFVAETANKNEREAAVLEQFMRQVALGLVMIDDGESQAQLGRALVRLSMRAANSGNVPADLSFQGRVRRALVNLEGRLSAADPSPNTAQDSVFADPASDPETNLSLMLDGMVGKMPVALDGFVFVNVDGRRGPRGVVLNVSGNVGTTPISFNTQREQ